MDIMAADEDEGVLHQLGREGRKQELKDFHSKESFSKKSPITDWEKLNTLDC